MTTLSVPHSLEAEEAVLGCLLLDADAIVGANLRPADFFHGPCRSIFEACLAVSERGEDAVNAITVAYELAQSDRLPSIGGHAYLSQLASGVVSTVFLEHYADVVRSAAVRRRLIAAAGQIAALGYEGGPDADVILAKAEEVLAGVGDGQSDEDFVPLAVAVNAYLDGIVPEDSGEQNGARLATGYRQLDRVLGGLHRSDLVILAARPGMGKTALALAIGHYAAEHGTTVALFSLEMGTDQLVARLIANESGIDVQRIDLYRSGALRLADDEEERFIAAAAGLCDVPVFVDDSSTATVSEIRQKARRLAKRKGLDLIVVDYLQLIGGSGERGENRVQQMSEISRSLKGLARELNVPVLALSQLSRAVEQRTPHIPQLSDLRDSGSIEQDADVVLFIYREDAYFTEEEWGRRFPTRKYPEGIANILVAKHRNGPTGQVDLYFQRKTARFFTLATGGEQE